MSNQPEGFNQSIAHITHNKNGETFIFQVLNAEGTDWDEVATRAAYDQWRDQNDPTPGG